MANNLEKRYYINLVLLKIYVRSFALYGKISRVPSWVKMIGSLKFYKEKKTNDGSLDLGFWNVALINMIIKLIIK
jgi:hypothetical protein